ncbi:MAG: phospho-N-acetylmuramoyl-pentapeptide-transferase [Bacteroidia bacterium]|nr:phospho-N-acetylmuramoyl-pentapeptide-transferase [Bacteroidia bacterium]
MLIPLFKYLETFGFPGATMFNYISFRSAMAVIVALLFSTIVGKKIIYMLQRQQIGEEIRDLGLEGQMQKKGTPTMGGLLIIASILLPTLLFAKLDNIYIVLMIITTIWLGLIGFADDYIKVFLKDKEGLAGKFKIIGQVSLGIIVATTLYLSSYVTIKEKIYDDRGRAKTESVINPETGKKEIHYMTKEMKTTRTTIPFIKSHEFDYKWMLWFLGDQAEKWAWLLYGIVAIFIITAVSNGANLTDGLDGLATGASAISGATLGVFAYLGGNMIYAGYLNIMYIPYSGELTVFMSAFIGACIGFLWYNSYPAQVFMGDTGSLTLGGILAVFAIIIRKEILIPLLCGIFLVENLSVIIQVAYFKYTKRKYGEGRRVFLMSPLHHHFQKKGFPEAKIVTRFWIVGIILAVLTIATLKMR